MMVVSQQCRAKTHLLYAWKPHFAKKAVINADRKTEAHLSTRELVWVAEEHDILENATAYPSSGDWIAFMRVYNRNPLMSQCGHCRNNVVAENFISSCECFRHRTCDACQVLIDDIEMFYYPPCQRIRGGMLSPIECSQQQILNV
ncbi:hypothetical protein [Gluconobacter thailandicus]|nr:hypothetical protein [Gluconobacter thailandicus]